MVVAWNRIDIHVGRTRIEFAPRAAHGVEVVMRCLKAYHSGRTARDPTPQKPPNGE